MKPVMKSSNTSYLNKWYVWAGLLVLILNLNSNVVKGQAWLDHAIILIPSDAYPQALLEYENNGFNIKKGRLHSNGILNNHIKFANGSSIELLTITTSPTDEISRGYAELMDSGQKGVYIALQINNAEKLSRLLRDEGIANSLIKNKSWNYLTFPKESGLEMIFLIEMKAKIDDDPAVFRHKNNINAIAEVYVYGDKRLRALLEILKLEGNVNNDQQFGSCMTYTTSTGSLVILSQPAGSSRIRRIVFSGASGTQLVKDFY